MIRSLSTTSLLLALAGTAAAQVAPDMLIRSTPRTANGPLQPSQQVFLASTGSDSCATADPIAGAGMFAFDNTLATTGPEGQFNAGCTFYNNSNVLSDVWFAWTAPAPGGLVEFSTCNAGTAVDTKIAAYSGTCGALTLLACNDDVSLLQSKVLFNAVAGQTYLLQIGLYPGAPAAVPGAGMFSMGYVTLGCSMDDGVSENAFHWNPATYGAGELMWMQRYGNPGASTTVTAIDYVIGGAIAGAQTLPNGTNATVYVYEDPNDDGNPNDGVIVSQQATVIANAGTDTFNTVNLTTPAVVSGYFFVAVRTPNGGTAQYVAATDDNSCGNVPGASWMAGNTAAFDPVNLGANSIPPAQMETALQYPTAFLLRATCSSGPIVVGTPYCFGDGTGTACPCGNNGIAGNGCASSVNANGGNVAATGNASISSDTVILAGTGMPNSSALYFQGTIQQAAGAGSAFGDGKRCAGGTVVRLGTKANVAGASQYPVGADLSVAAKGLVVAPGTRTYQVWYRNAAAFCTPSTFNLTNGLEINWGA